MAYLSLELDDIQAVVRGYPRSWTRSRFVYLTFPDRDSGQQILITLQNLLGNPTSVAQLQNDSGADLKHAYNIAFSYAGLAMLGVYDGILDSFPNEFRRGMASRAELIGDVEESDPSHWDSHWQGEGVHAVLALYGKDDQELQSLVDWAAINLPAVATVAYENGSRLRVGNTPVWIDDADSQPPPDTLVEHFGFNDAVTNPAVEHLDERYLAGNGKFHNGRWMPLAAGEFLFGHTDEVGELALAPKPDRLAHNGSFMVYRKLSQDVQGFRQYVKEQAAAVDTLGFESGGLADYIAAKMVGRRRDGSHFIDRQTPNDFLFHTDPAGKHCPLGSHIRRVNPRDTMGFETRLVNRHRILRRSFAYGDLVPRTDGAELPADSTDQGLIFIALNASITRQFEFIQQQWINFGNDLDQGDDRDPLVGNQDGFGQMRILADDLENRPGIVCGDLKRFVITRGGEYFFLPSVGAFRDLVSGDYWLTASES